MNVNKILARVQQRVEAYTEEARRDEEWFNSLSKAQQKAYIKKYPGSKFNPNRKKTQEKPGAGAKGKPKAGGSGRPKKKVDPANPGGKKKVDPANPGGAKKKPAGKKPAEKKPAAKKPTSKKPEGKRGRPKKVLNQKEKRQAIAKRKNKIKEWEKRLKVLDAERGFRRAAMSYTKRPSTKKNMQERMKKITEMKKKVEARIKKAEDTIKNLTN